MHGSGLLTYQYEAKNYTRGWDIVLCQVNISVRHVMPPASSIKYYDNQLNRNNFTYEYNTNIIKLLSLAVEMCSTCDQFCSGCYTDLPHHTHYQYAAGMGHLT